MIPPSAIWLPFDAIWLPIAALLDGKRNDEGWEGPTGAHSLAACSCQKIIWLSKPQDARMLPNFGCAQATSKTGPWCPTRSVSADIFVDKTPPQAETSGIPSASGGQIQKAAYPDIKGTAIKPIHSTLSIVSHLASHGSLEFPTWCMRQLITNHIKHFDCVVWRACCQSSSIIVQLHIMNLQPFQWQARLDVVCVDSEDLSSRICEWRRALIAWGGLMPLTSVTSSMILSYPLTISWWPVSTVDTIFLIQNLWPVFFSWLCRGLVRSTKFAQSSVFQRDDLYVGIDKTTALRQAYVSHATKFGFGSRTI